MTGASSGVGEASAKAIAARGATVLCVARRQGELDRVVGEVVAAGGSAYGYACDLTDPTATDTTATDTTATDTTATATTETATTATSTEPAPRQ